jgi:AcrR family transcriptional regulator
VPETTKPLRRDARRNRERILVAAREVFAARGVHATLDDVAARAGVGVGTVYRRYANKDALLDELLEAVVVELAEFAEAAAEGPDAWAALIAVLERIEEASAANRALEHLVVQRDPARRLEHLADARERLLVPLGALVERAKAEGRLRADFETADVANIHAMLAAVPRDPPDLWRRYFAIVVDGLSRAEAPPRTPRR